MKALMLAFACRQQYHTMRAAAEAGYNVCVLGKDCAQGLKHSRYCDDFHTLQFDPVTCPIDIGLAEINQWARRLSADVILPSDIISTRLLSALAGRLAVPSCLLPAPACFDVMNDKWRFYQFCQARGIHVPQTWLFNSLAELKVAAAQGKVPFPLIIKPHNSMGSSGLHRIMNAADLAALGALPFSPLLVQQLIAGDEIDISLLAYKGKIAAYAVQRYVPMKYIFLQHEAILREASRVVEASGFEGIAHFDAIEEKTTGKIYLIECNPRVWYSIFAATIGGLNFVELSLKAPQLDTDNPRCLANVEVAAGKATIPLLRKLVMQFGMEALEARLLKYNLADPLGKRCSQMKRYDDSLLAAHQQGSIASQIAALSALQAA